MSELSHPGAYRLIHQSQLNETEHFVLRSHLQACAACRQHAEMADLLSSHFVLQPVSLRPSPQFTADFGEKAARRSRMKRIMKPVYAAGGLAALLLIVLAGWLIMRTNPALSTPDAGTPDDQLVEAVMAGDTVEVGKLLSAGANPNSHDNDGNALLPLAAKTGERELVQQLLDAGADVNSRMNPSGSDKTALMEAVIGKDRGMIELLIAAGADVNQMESNSGYSVLHFAANYNIVSDLPILLNSGADPNLQDKDGRTPLHKAARFGYVTAIWTLLKSGAALDIADNEGLTPLLEVTKKGRGYRSKSIIIILLDSGSDPNWQDNCGNTTLHHAVLTNNTTVIPTLIKHGASLDLKNNEGQTALDLAVYDLTRDTIRAAAAEVMEPN